MYEELPDAFLDALADAVADVRREGQREIERISAEARATIAECKAEIADLRGAIRAMGDEQVVRVSSAVASIKDGAPGRDGRDADPLDMAHVEKLIDGKVAAVVAAIPVPQDGKDGHSPTADELAPIVQSAVERAAAALPPPLAGQDGLPGQNGKDAEPVTHEQIVETIKSLPGLFDEAVLIYFAAHPIKDGQDGAPGRDGKDADPVTAEQIADAVKSAPELFDEAVARYFVANPPKDGRDGIDGRDGASILGPAGKDAEPLTIKQIAEAIEAAPEPLDGAVARFLTANPPQRGSDGIDGAKGDPGPPGKDAEPVTKERIVDAVLACSDALRDAVVKHLTDYPPAAGRDGIDGKDGVGLAGALIDRSGSLVLTLGNGTVRDLGCVVGKDADQALVGSLIREEVAKLPPPRDGRDGTDGKDGLGFEDMLPPEYDGKRTVTFRFKRGDRVSEWPIKLDIPWDAGVFREGQPYEKSDFTTFGGRTYIAQCDTSEKPDTKDWRLMANRGRDGKDGVMRQIAPPAPIKLG